MQTLRNVNLVSSLVKLFSFLIQIATMPYANFHGKNKIESLFPAATPSLWPHCVIRLRWFNPIPRVFSSFFPQQTCKIYPPFPVPHCALKKCKKKRAARITFFCSEENVTARTIHMPTPVIRAATKAIAVWRSTFGVVFPPLLFSIPKHRTRTHMRFAYRCNFVCVSKMEDIMLPSV